MQTFQQHPVCLFFILCFSFDNNFLLLSGAVETKASYTTNQMFQLDDNTIKGAAKISFTSSQTITKPRSIVRERLLLCQNFEFVSLILCLIDTVVFTCGPGFFTYISCKQDDNVFNYVPYEADLV